MPGFHHISYFLGKKRQDDFTAKALLGYRKNDTWAVFYCVRVEDVDKLYITRDEKNTEFRVQLAGLVRKVL